MRRRSIEESNSVLHNLSEIFVLVDVFCPIKLSRSHVEFPVTLIGHCHLTQWLIGGVRKSPVDESRAAKPLVNKAQ